MTKKICSKCKIEKDVCEFYKNPKKEGEVRTRCKKCMNKISLENYYQNVETERERRRKYHKQYYLENKEKENLRNKTFRENNLEKIREIQRLSSKKIRDRDPEKHRDKTREWRKNNPDYNVQYNQNRRKTDIFFKFKTNVRNRIREFLKTKNINKKNKTFDIVGCSPNYLREHIEKQFLEGMNWENYGFYGWHIDHKITLSSAKNEEEILKLFHYTNLQPLWAEDNLKKSNKII